MIAWNRNKTKLFSEAVFQWRVWKAQLNFFDHLSVKRKSKFKFCVRKAEGYQSKLASLKNKFHKKPCTIVANGPSLNDSDPNLIRQTVSIGCNGIFKRFPEWGFETNFLVFEDIEQFEIRAKELGKTRYSQKLAGIYNAYCVKDHKEWLFFHAPRSQNHSYYFHDESIYPEFSKDFAGIVHLGSTVSFIMLQLAYHIGCDPVIIIGLDHDYGELQKLYPPGKVAITEENISIVRECHFQENYYKIGDVVGVPWVEKQEQAFQSALNAFAKDGRTLLNASKKSNLGIIPRVSEERAFAMINFR